MGLEQFLVHPVKNASDLIDLLRPTNRLWAGQNAHWGFRGQSDSTWQLVPRALRVDWQSFLPSKMQSSLSNPMKRQVDNECKAFLRFFELADETGQYVPGAEFVRSQEFEQLLYTQPHLDRWPFSGIVEGLAIAQHHGIPTRLLDFTYAGLVAAYFAANDAIANKLEKSKAADQFSVWAVNLDFIKHAWGDWLNRRLNIVEVPLARNPFLRAQRGFFIYDSKIFDTFAPTIDFRIQLIKPLDEVILTHANGERAWRTLSDIGISCIPPIMHRFDVPLGEADKLLSLLYEAERISKAHLMPTLDNVSATLKFMDKVTENLPSTDL